MAKDCLNLIIVILDIYLYLEDWYRVHFSNKVYFGYGTKDKFKII